MTQSDLEVSAAGTTPVTDPTELRGQIFRLTDYYEVGREKIREFAHAVQNEHPTHLGEDAAQAAGYPRLIAPTTFTAILASPAQAFVFAQVLDTYDLSQVLHTAQRIIAYRPILAGDILRTEIALDSLRRRDTHDTFVFRCDFRDDAGQLRQTALTTAVGRSGGDIDPRIAEIATNVVRHNQPIPRGHNTGEIIEPIAEHTGIASAHAAELRSFDSVSVGDELPAHSALVTRGDLVDYAGVSGDPNPIHFSDALAARAGLDGVVVHGMLTMGIGVDFLVDWAGDPAALVDYDVRFSSPVLVDPEHPATIDFQGKVKSVDPQRRTATIALTAIHDGRRVFGRATAIVALG